MTTENFWDRHASRYAARPIADPTAYEAMLARVRSHLDPEARMLEIGCGTGGTALRLAPAVAHVTATDSSQGMVRIAVSRLGPDAPGNVAFRQAGAAEIIDTGPFDAICAFSLLHLIDDVPGLLRILHAQLKPGGLLMSKTVCLKDRGWPIRFLVRFLTAIGFAPTVTMLGRTELEQLIRAAGFELVETVCFDRKALTPFIVARKLPAA